jgi:hypothetical protein
MTIEDCFELPDQLALQTEREVGLNPLLEREQMELFQPIGLESQGTFVRELSEGPPVPELER